MVEQRRRCRAITRGGKQCAITPPRDRDFCLHHDPARREEARATRRRGGYNRAARARSAKLAKYGVQTMADLEEIGMLAVCEMRYGLDPEDPDGAKLDVAVARGMAAMISVLRHVAVATEYERQIAELREMLAALIAEKDRDGADDLQTA
jgi:hypothetical protein